MGQDLSSWLNRGDNPMSKLLIVSGFGIKLISSSTD